MNLLRLKLVMIFIFFVIFEITGKTGFFKYIKLDEGTKCAVKDYHEHYDYNKMLIMVYNNNSDTTTFTLVGDIGISSFIKSPSMFYSLYMNRIILIYNGEENDFTPNPIDMSLMFDFLSNFVDTEGILKCNWDKDEIIYKKTFMRHVPIVYDPIIMEYKVSKDTIINKKIFYGEGGYPLIRFRPKFIEQNY